MRKYLFFTDESPKVPIDAVSTEFVFTFERNHPKIMKSLKADCTIKRICGF